MSSWPCLLQSLPVDGLKFFQGGGETRKHSLKFSAKKHLKIGHSKRKGIHLPTIHFQVRHVSFRGRHFLLVVLHLPQIPREPNMHFAPPSYIVIHFLQKKSAELPVAQKIGIKALIEQCPKLMVKFKFKTYKIIISYHTIPCHNYHIIPYHNMQMISYHTSKSYLIKCL